MRLVQFFVGAQLLLLVGASPALATLITFDDIPAVHRVPPDGHGDYPDYIPEYDDELFAMPLTDQYEHLGVTFGDGNPDDIVQGIGGNGGAAVSLYEPALVSPPQAISDLYGPDMSFSFIGDDLPGYVSFNVTGMDGVGIWASAYDTDGNQVADLRSDGWWGTPEMSTPAIPGQLLEFEADNIKTVQLGNLYFRRGMTHLDNLYFSDTRPVPEAATWPLLILAMLGLSLSRYRKHPACRLNQPCQDG